MSGKNAWIVWMVPRRLTSRIFLIDSKDCTSNGPIRPTPALHTVNTENTDAPTHARLFFRNYRAYPKRLSVSPQSSPSPPGWTAGWSHPSGVCPRCPCGDLWRFPKDVPFWTDFSLLHKLERTDPKKTGHLIKVTSGWTVPPPSTGTNKQHKFWLPLNAFWGSDANRTARLRPIPEEQPVINTTFASMAPTDRLKRREAEERRTGFPSCFSHLATRPVTCKHLPTISHLQPSRYFHIPS